MVSNLSDMLSDLAKDPQKLADFKISPENVMDKYGLTQEQKDLIDSGLKGKQHDFHKAFGNGAFDAEILKPENVVGLD